MASWLNLRREMGQGGLWWSAESGSCAGDYRGPSRRRRMAEEGGRRAGLARGGGEEAEGRMRGSGVSGGLMPPTFIPPFSPFLFSFFLFFVFQKLH